MESFKVALIAVAFVHLHRVISATVNTAESEDCSVGFLKSDNVNKGSLVALPDYSLPIEDYRSSFVQWIFPNMRLTCNSYIRSWMLNVNVTTLSETVERPIPQITTWREVLPKINPGFFEQQSITNESWETVNISSDGSFHVYTYTPSQPIPVQSGDIVGIMMPLDEEERMESIKPLFLELPEDNSSLFSCTRFGDSQQISLNEQNCGQGQQEMLRYILSISAIVDDTTSPSPTASTVLPSPTPSVITVDPTLSGNPATSSESDSFTTSNPTTTFPGETSLRPSSNQIVSVVVGAVLAAVAVVLIIALVVLLVLILIRRRQKDRQQLYDVPHDAETPQPQNMDNPMYTSSTAECNGHSSSTNVYATPSPTQMESPHPIETNIVAEHYEFSQDVVSPSIEHQYELEPAEPAYQDPEYAQPTVSRIATLSQPYEVPLSALSTLARTEDHSSLDRHIYSVLEGGIYVPTEDERRSLSRTANSTSTSGTGVFDDNIYARMSKKYKNRLDESHFFEQEEVYWKPASNQTALYHQLSKKKYREILRQQIQIIKHLGAGQFGTVSKGVWESHYGSIEVAVKMLQPQALEEEKVKFLQEAAIMGQFLHPNIVKLHGVVTVDQPVMIVLEYMKNGDLREYLLAQRPTKEGEVLENDLPERFLKFCRAIASGMNYLANKAFVHRDLAARNILVSEDETCKIGDFGMSRDLEDNHYYITHGGKIPVKWTAPEALHFRKYSTASDVWSFGCVMYEIWSLGHKPFESYSNIQAMQMIGSGYRLPPPPGCPKPLYSLMIRCWHSDASVRPMFSAIFKMLSHSDSQLLSWSDKDKRVHPEACCIGAPLEAGDELYPDLQDYYLDEPSKRL